MTYKGLSLNRDLINSSIKEGFGEDTGITIEEKPTGLHIYTVKVTGHVPATLNIYFLKEGATTLFPDVGKNQDLSNKIAAYISSHCKTRDVGTKSFYIKKVREEDFETIIEFLVSECKSTVIDEKALPTGRQVNVQGRQGDILHFNYYNNHALQIQGNPRLLFQDTVMIMSELLPFEDVINEQLRYYEADGTLEDVLNELEQRMPEACKKIEEKIKTVISSALAFQKLRIDLPDYSSFPFPALRGLEGVMKQIFSENGVIVTKGGFGTYFVSNGSGYVFKEEEKSKIKEPKVRKILEDLYSFYYRDRHSLFHMDGTVSTSRTINNQHDAIVIIDETLDLIEKSFVILNKI